MIPFSRQKVLKATFIDDDSVDGPAALDMFGRTRLIMTDLTGSGLNQGVRCRTARRVAGTFSSRAQIGTRPMDLESIGLTPRAGRHVGVGMYMLCGIY